MLVHRHRHGHHLPVLRHRHRPRRGPRHIRHRGLAIRARRRLVLLPIIVHNRHRGPVHAAPVVRHRHRHRGRLELRRHRHIRRRHREGPHVRRASHQHDRTAVRVANLQPLQPVARRRRNRQRHLGLHRGPREGRRHGAMRRAFHRHLE